MVSNPFGTGVTGSGEPSNGNSDSLQVQYVLLTAWQSLQPLTFSFLMLAIKSTSYRYGSLAPTTPYSSGTFCYSAKLHGAGITFPGRLGSGLLDKQLYAQYLTQHTTGA